MTGAKFKYICFLIHVAAKLQMRHESGPELKELPYGLRSLCRGTLGSVVLRAGAASTVVDAASARGLGAALALTETAALAMGVRDLVAGIRCPRLQGSKA